MPDSKHIATAYSHSNVIIQNQTQKNFGPYSEESRHYFKQNLMQKSFFSPHTNTMQYLTRHARVTCICLEADARFKVQGSCKILKKNHTHFHPDVSHYTATMYDVLQFYSHTMLYLGENTTLCTKCQSSVQNFTHVH